MAGKPKKSLYQTIIESKLINLLDDTLIEKFETDEYYDWIINPRTKKKLQLDILITFKDKVWISKKNGTKKLQNVQLAIEVQGEQHYKFFEEFHKKEYGFKSLQFRDQFKFDICKKVGIPLIRIKYKKISWKCDIRKLVLNQLRHINRKPKENTTALIEIFENSTYPINHSNIDQETIFRINEFVNFLKSD